MALTFAGEASWEIISFSCWRWVYWLQWNWVFFFLLELCTDKSSEVLPVLWRYEWDKEEDTARSDRTHRHKTHIVSKSERAAWLTGKFLCKYECCFNRLRKCSEEDYCVLCLKYSLILSSCQSHPFCSFLELAHQLWDISHAADYSYLL